MPAPAWRPPPRWPWEEAVDRVRRHPGVPMVVARYTRGGPAVTRKAQINDYNSLRRGLVRHYPAEDWRLQTRTIPDTWYHRMLILTFVGQVTPEVYERRVESNRREREHLRQTWAKVAARRKATNARMRRDIQDAAERDR